MNFESNPILPTEIFYWGLDAEKQTVSYLQNWKRVSR